jgi:hypothetical protein
MDDHALTTDVAVVAVCGWYPYARYYAWRFS